MPRLLAGIDSDVLWQLQNLVDEKAMLLWQHVILRSWLSWVCALFVLAGYFQLGRRKRSGWIFVIISQIGLVAIGIADEQYGLLVALVLMMQAGSNWWDWGRPHPEVVRLEEELQAARAENEELRLQLSSGALAT